MVLFKFGNFDWACRNVPSLPVCNLFYRQLLVHPHGLTAPATSILGLPDASSSNFTQALAHAGVGVNPSCSISRMAATGGPSGSLGNIANIVLCGLSVIIALVLAVQAGRRAAAVGRIEMRILFLVYALVQAAQLVDTGAFLRAGGTALSWVSAVHLGLVVGMFWTLLWVAFLSLQVVEDGTLPSIAPMVAILVILTVGSSYIFVDTAFTVTNYFVSKDPAALHSIWIFVLTIIWPAVAAFVYYVVQMMVVVRVLKETKPLLLFSGSAFLFILSQADYFALSHTICKGSNGKVDGSFIATLLETAAVGVLWDGVAYMD
ncbi:hypothetical protein T439DRAFT_359726 [Meredithblackwellia eburnea MCA 4105]